METYKGSWRQFLLTCNSDTPAEYVWLRVHPLSFRSMIRLCKEKCSASAGDMMVQEAIKINRCCSLCLLQKASDRHIVGRPRTWWRAIFLQFGPRFEVPVPRKFKLPLSSPSLLFAFYLCSHCHLTVAVAVTDRIFSRANFLRDVFDSRLLVCPRD